jgi:hypothetical protein
MSMNQWDERYAANDFVCGTKPKDVLRSLLACRPPASMSDRRMTADGLTHELTNMYVIQCQEIERDIHEGTLHNGHSSVVQCIAIKEGSAQ